MEMRELVIRNRDGKRMAATLTLPGGAPQGTAVLLHGLGGWKDQPVLKTVAKTLVEEGYVVLRFNESDSVVSPDGDFFATTTTQTLRDVEDAIAYAQEAEWYQEPLLLAGHSMGGFAAAWYAAHHPGIVARLVLLAPAVSWKTMWYGQLPYEFIWLLRGHMRMLGMDGKRFALGPQWVRDWHRYDGSADAERIAIPTLVISADKDHTVARPREHRRYTKRFSRGAHSTISWADHDFDGQGEEVAATIKQWLTSS